MACKNILNALTVYCLVDLNAAAVMKIGSKTKRNVKRNIESNAAMAKIKETIKKQTRTIQPVNNIMILGISTIKRSVTFFSELALQAKDEPMPDGMAEATYKLHNIQSILSFIVPGRGLIVPESL